MLLNQRRDTLIYNLCMYPALFLDRDGVIIENRSNYVRSISDIEFFPRALTALRKASTLDQKIILVSNQSAVGRGIITMEQAETINNNVIERVIDFGGRIDGAYLCPHSPEDQCECRKPKPGMLLEAASAFPLDVGRSIMIGDAWSDVQAGRAAGITKLVLVKTGRGKEQISSSKEQSIGSVFIYDDLLDAIDNIFGL